MFGINFAIAFVGLLLLAGLLSNGSSNYFVSDNEPSDTNADSANVPLTEGDFNVSGLQQKIQALMQAIAYAEGFYLPDGSVNDGAVPVRANNPNDLKVGNVGYGVILANGSVDTVGNKGITIFANVQDGWARAQHQCTLMLTGRSKVYSFTDTWWNVAAKFAGGDLNWGKNTAAALGVSPDSTLGDLANA